MATTTKMSKTHQIEELTAKVKELTEKIDDLNISNGDLVKENEELQIENELLKAEVEELKTKKNTTKKEPETFTGTLKEYREWGKDVITKKELLEWVDNPDEVKTITRQSKKPHDPSGNPEKASKEGTCYAMANWGKTKCYRTGMGDWCYCKQHFDMFQKGKLHGDARLGTEWEKEEEWKLINNKRR